MGTRKRRRQRTRRRRKGSGEWGVGSGNKEISFPSPFPIPTSTLPFYFFLFAFCRLTLDVPAAQGYRIERHIENDSSGRGDHLQAEPITHCRLAAVDEKREECMVPSAVQRGYWRARPTFRPVRSVSAQDWTCQCPTSE